MARQFRDQFVATAGCGRHDGIQHSRHRRLEQKLIAVPVEALRAEIATIVRAAVKGLT
jgi:hypothetical protein